MSKQTNKSYLFPFLDFFNSIFLFSTIGTFTKSGYKSSVQVPLRLHHAIGKIKQARSAQKSL